MANSQRELPGGKPLIKLGMVDWFKPAQLMRTGVSLMPNWLKFMNMLENSSPSHPPRTRPRSRFTVFLPTTGPFTITGHGIDSAWTA